MDVVLFFLSVISVHKVWINNTIAPNKDIHHTRSVQSYSERAGVGAKITSESTESD